MGLRERNAARTRSDIVQAALDLFVERGFDTTTMEEVATRAGVGTSTLYRYFPTKDLLVTDQLALRGQMAAELTGRPEDEPLDLALGHALTALLLAPRADTETIRQLDAVIRSTPGLLVSMQAEFLKERTLLQEAIAERTGRSTDDPFCQMTAHMATSLLEMVSNYGAEAAADNATAARQAADAVRATLYRLHEDPPTLPRIE
jgi:AcrR family transcriptional regulator